MLMATFSVTTVRNLLGALGLPPSAAYLVALLPSAVGAGAYAIARSVSRPLAQ
jgi:hypothetical protein